MTASGIDAAALERDGWVAFHSSGFNAAVEPFWIRGKSQPEVGLLIEQRHCNTNLGTVHGGVIMTLSDIGLGLGAARALGHSHMVTAQLSVQFLGLASIGTFLWCRPEVVKQSRHLVFVRSLLLAGETTIASADGIWKVIAPTK